MADRGGRLTAQLGCGALILVVIAAFIGATAGTERMRSATVGATAPAKLPPIFREGNLVLMGTTEMAGQTPVPVLRVVEVNGTWVRLRVDIDASVSRLSQYANANDEDKERLRANYARNTIPGEWWLNLAASSISWSEYKAP